MSALARSPLRVLRRVAALAFVGVLAVPGIALASCPTQPVSNPFSQWGDNNNYFLAPGGSFEGTTDQVGWTLSGASLTQGNEPFYVDSSSDSQSLTISGGGSAISPFFCVDNTMGSLRFFAQQIEAGGGLHVYALVQTANGVQTVPVARLLDGSMPSWAPTQPITGDTENLSDDQTLQVALEFSVRAWSASWQIDDVYVDPYRSG
ncbi:MAG TPA: hypothetical protein VGP11_03795 [Acidimicrobiales bacterium]|nr:hypothetical protein [Acidimicrobiales bacterium]